MEKTNKKLGRTLKSIFSDTYQNLTISDMISDIENISEYEVKNLPLDLIITNPYQPRKNFDMEKLKELADSINEYGVIQPIVVRMSGKNYQILAGERRYRACKILNLKKIPSVIKDFNEEDLIQLSVLENIQREDLSVIEEAKAYDLFLKKMHLTQENLSKKIGKSRSYITNILRLLDLPQIVQQYLSINKITMGHAKILVNLSEKNIVTIVEKIIKENLSVRETEKLVKKSKINKHDKKIKKPKYSELQTKLEKYFNENIKLSSKSLSFRINDEDHLKIILKKIGYYS